MASASGAHESSGARRRPWLDLALAVHLGILLLVLYVARLDLQWSLLPGDHGREIYCFYRTGRGAVPYRDFQWTYGWLMPYVYGGVFRLFGESLLVLRAVFLALLLAAGGCAFGAVRRQYGTFAAHVGAFLVFLWGTPPHSFNHAALAVMVTAGCWSLFAALEADRLRPSALLLAYLPALVGGGAKWSSGIAWIAIATLLLGVKLWILPPTGVRRGRDFLPVVVAAALALVLVTGAYGLLFAGVPAERLRTSFEGMTGRQWAEDRSLLGEMLLLPRHFLAPLLSWAIGPEGAAGFLELTAKEVAERASLTGLLTSLRSPAVVLPFGLLVLGIAGAAWLLHTARTARRWEPAAVRILCAWVTTLLLTHEYLLRGSTYSLAYLALLPLFLLGVGLLGLWVASWSAARRTWIGRGALVAWLLLSSGWTAHQVASSIDRPRGARMTSPRAGGIWVSSPWMREHFDALVACVTRLTAPGEPVAVLPYDSLVNFLADRSSPFYSTAVLYGFPWSEQAEDRLIRDLDAGHVRCVVLTNGTATPAHSVGYFGYTHLPRLAEYITTHYRIVATLGFSPWRQYVLGDESGKQSLVYWRKDAPLPPDAGGAATGGGS